MNPDDLSADETVAVPGQRTPTPSLEGALFASRYRLVSLLGAGGMGAVYKAQDERLQRMVAVKILHTAPDPEPEMLARFEREARAASSLNHPNICTVFDIGEEGGRPFLVLELLEGETVASRIRHAGPLLLHDVLDAAVQIADALDSAHQHGIVHRDIKPANLFLTSRGQAKLLDFGVAKLLTHNAPETAELTHSGRVLGTVAYMAPEQAYGQDLDGRADLFSLGAVLYEMTSGRAAFSGATLPAISQAVLNEEPAWLSSASAQIPEEFSRIVARALSKDRVRRYPDALALLADLRNFKQSQLVTVSPAAARAPADVRLQFADSIAVLPFESTARDPDLEYLGEGIAERILNSLSQLAALRVVPRATAFRYRPATSDPAQVGRELGVRVVLAGRVSERAGRLTIGTELIDSARGSLLWGDKYDRGLDDVLAIESEMAKEIVARLRVRLTPAEGEQLFHLRTTSVEAYKLLMKALYYANQWTREGLQKGITYLRQAIDTDPSYPAAYAGLGYIYVLLGFFGMLAPRDAFPRAKSAALRILDLDDNRASAHLLLGFSALSFDWDWALAEKHIRTALNIMPSYGNSHWVLGYWLCAMGRFDEAIASMQQAVALDPLSAPTRSGLGTAYYWARKYELAEQAYRAAIETDPRFVGAYHVLSVLYAQQGRFDEGLALLDQIDAREHVEREHVARALIYAIAGDQDASRRFLARLDYTGPEWRAAIPGAAAVYAALGEEQQALDLLERSYQDRASYLVLLAKHPNYERLYSHPRFVDLLRRIGLPPTVPLTAFHAT
jgi:TolB-like protein/Tfp pilus assembly protein PilF